MAITSYKTEKVNATSYLIVCPYEGTFTTGDTVKKSGLKIENFTWTWPDYFGKDAPVGAYLRYLWTDKIGNLEAFIAEGSKGSVKKDCATLGDLSSVYALSTNQKKSQINITPLSSLKLLKATQNKSEMTIILTTTGETTNSETTQKCSVSFDKVSCTFVKAENVYTFTLTNINTENDYTITQAAISITFWFFIICLFILHQRISSSVSSDTATTYTATINGYFYDNYPEQKDSRPIILADCSSTAAWGYTAAISRSITVDDLVTETSIANARGYFSFKFSSSNEFLDESKFTIDLSFLSTTNSLLMKNLRCLAYKNNAISHDFAIFDISSFSSISLEYRKKYSSSLARPYEYSSIAYEFKCYGTQFPETIATNSKIHVTNIIGTSMTADGYSADQSTKKFTTISTSSVATISMTKTFNFTGQEATYTFKVITKQVADSPSTIQFKAGSYLYVEFARDINPRFNKLGIIRCYQESEPTYCSYESERRIAFIVRTDLNHNKTEGYQFSIVGVHQPASLANYNTMYFALVPYLGTLKTLLFQDNQTIIDTITADSGTVTTLEVTQYEQSTTQIRSTFQLTMTIRFPINSIQDNIPIWVDLPEEFDEATFLGWIPSCKLQNVKAVDTQIMTNYVSSCSLNSTRRIKLNLNNAASYSAKKLFQLTIGSIPTYNYEQFQQNAPLVWFGNSDNPMKPLYRTNINNFNGTYNLASFNYTDDKQKLITWKSTTVTCIVGTYQCYASLIPQTQERFYLDLTQFTSSGTHSSYFSFNPSKLVATTGKGESKFDIAPKADTAPGLYQLKFKHESASSYYVIPPLFLIVLNSQIKVNPNAVAFEVPKGGRSLPIIFDFKGKMPETDVTIIGVAESSSNSPQITFQSAQQTLIYRESSAQTQIQFVVKADKVTSESNSVTSSKLSWSIAGTNVKSYSTPDSVTLNIVDPPGGTPELTVQTIDSNAVGQQTFIAKCTHAGVLYYVISQDQLQTEIEFTAIQSESEDKNIQETEIGSVQTNPSMTFYGYQAANVANNDNQITISGKFQSQAKYYMRMYCANLVNTISVPQNVSWTQVSNNGKPMIATIQFTNAKNNQTNAALNDTQRKEIACIICKQTQIEKQRVFAANGIACGETVSSTNTTTTNTTTRILLVENATSEYFVVMPDLFSSDGSLDIAKTKLESTEFQTTLSSSTLLSELKMQAISCSINSDYPAIPCISAPSVFPSQSSITFTWMGANNTDGFVFVGIVAATNGTVAPTELQLKKNQGYSFIGFNKAFYNKNKQVAVTISPVTECSDYSYYWVATNEDADTYQYSSGLQQGTTTTIGCGISAQLLSVKMIGLLLLIILLI